MDVQDGRVVVLHYTMTGPDGETIESTRGGLPMAYLHGRGQLLSGLERALAGHVAGDRVQATLGPADAYGERKGQGAQAVPRREFGKNVDLRVGMPLELKGGDGATVRVWVTKVQGSKVWIDIDHPLAGRTLGFDVEVVFVRAPTPEEIEHGHAHGPGGDGRHG